MGEGYSYGLDTLLEKQASFLTILPKVYYSQRPQEKPNSNSQILCKRGEKAEASSSICVYILVLLLKSKTRVFSANRRVDPRGQELFIKESKGPLARVDRSRPSK
jgi:hypothetical protein